MSSDTLGDRMKSFEAVSSYKLIKTLPIIIRIDGKAFSSWTKGLAKPYDERLWKCFDETTRFLVAEVNAVIGYTQSDEVTLVLYQPSFDKGIFFEAKLNKLNSIIASLCTAKFNDVVKKYLPQKAEKYAIFDCRSFNVPSKEEAINCLIWREQDCTKNAVSSAAQTYFSHKSLQSLSTKQMQERLFQEKAINFNAYPTRFKRGVYFQRIKKEILFSAEELGKLPLKHEARRNPNLLVKRSIIEEIDFGMPLHKVDNRVERIFENFL